MRASDFAEMGLPESAALMVAGLSRACRDRSMASQPRRAISCLNRSASRDTLN